MPRYKRTRDEAELDLPLEPQVAPEQKETLRKLRNMWEFASLMQYIYLFGGEVKIDESFDIEDLEAECSRPTPSDKLASIGLALLKYVSSHRGLTPEVFEEYTRRQYAAKAPQRNPFGDEDEPVKFNDLDIFTRIRVLQQLSTWTFNNAERIRGMMPVEDDHLNWRMEPLGWDKEDRSYFVLDDNRLYRRTDEAVPLPAPKPKSKSKKKTPKKTPSRGTRTSKRRKIEDDEDEQDEEAADADFPDDTMITNDSHTQLQEDEAAFGFTSKTWECVAVTLNDYQEFLATIFRSRDPNEKQLYKRIEQDVLPIIEKRAEAIKQKQLRKMRELENLQKMATAKRSSRLADKADREKQEREEKELEEKRQREIQMAHEEQERQRRIEEGHESRRLTREQRIKEREMKRILHQEELAKLEEEAQRAQSQDPTSDSTDTKRMSERQLKNQKEQHQKELERLAEEDNGKWYFDCSICGMHGDNLDDGTHSIACDRCNVWQHSKCHGLTPKQAQREDFKFVCATCKRKEEDALKPRIPPLKLVKSRTDETPESQEESSRPATANGQQANGSHSHVMMQLDGTPIARTHHPESSPARSSSLNISPAPILSGPSLSPHGQGHGPVGYHYPPVGNFAPNAPQQPWQGNSLPPPARRPSSDHSTSSPPVHNGYGAEYHHERHQHAHQHALTAAGMHPQIRQPHAQSTHSQRPAGGVNATTHSSMNLTPQHNQNQQFQARPISQHQQRVQTPGPPAPLLNGFQSPVKQQPSSSPASHLSNSFSTPQQSFHQQHPSVQQHQRSPQLQQSPKTSLPPPTRDATQGVSPVKPSPPTAPTTIIASISPHQSNGQRQVSPATNVPRLTPISPQASQQLQLSPKPHLAPSPLPSASTPRVTTQVNGSLKHE